MRLDGERLLLVRALVVVAGAGAGELGLDFVDEAGHNGVRVVVVVVGMENEVWDYVLGNRNGVEVRAYKALRADDAQSLQDPEEALRMSRNVQNEANGEGCDVIQLNEHAPDAAARTAYTSIRAIIGEGFARKWYDGIWIVRWMIQFTAHIRDNGIEEPIKKAKEDRKDYFESIICETMVRVACAHLTPKVAYLYELCV